MYLMPTEVIAKPGGRGDWENPDLPGLISFSHRINTSSLLPAPVLWDISASLISLYKLGSLLLAAKLMPPETAFSTRWSPFVLPQDAECNKVGAVSFILASQRTRNSGAQSHATQHRTDLGLTSSREFWSFTLRAAFSSSSCFISFSDFFFTSSNCASTS